MERGLNKGLQLAINERAGESAKLWVKCEDCLLQMNSRPVAPVSK
ncbi:MULTISPECIES: hypothetical protein [Pseudomonas]|jgi:hypothetical protein|nr:MULTISPECIES: hypothetical protein [Pseudomonas]